MNKTISLAAIALVAMSGAAFAEGDAKKGKSVFRRCLACHFVDKDKNKLGPTLQGVMGRKAAAVEGFKYSPALKKKGEEGLVWNAETLNAYLESPKKYVPGGKMAFAGLPKEADRANIIAYIEEASKK